MRARYALKFRHLPLTQMLLGESFHPGGLELTNQLAIKSKIDSHSKVLDIGAGKCQSAHYLAQKFGCEVFALDKNSSYLSTNSSPLNGNVQGQVIRLQGDTHHLPIASNSMDVVLCECVLGSFDNRELVLAEIYRVLKSGGYLAISDIYLNEPLPIELQIELNRWLRIDSAYNSIRCREVIRRGGFERIRFKDASDQLLETIHTIEAKMRMPDRKLNDLITQDAIIQRSTWQLGISRRLAQFIYDGHAGYYTLTAIKPD